MFHNYLLSLLKLKAGVERIPAFSVKDNIHTFHGEKADMG
jgi:hypothetical protein